MISVFGAMFGPRPEAVARELTRVCRSGGRIVMACWTRDSFIAGMREVTARYVPPPSGLPNPAEWGDEEIVRQRLREGIAKLELTRRLATFEFPFDEAHVVEHFRQYLGPTIKAFESLDATGQAGLRRDAEAFWKQWNLAKDGTVRVDSEFLEIVATRS